MPNLALESITRNHELTGPAGAPVVVALGGISATAKVTSWWSDVAGSGRSIDTTRFQVLGLDYLDSGSGEGGRPPRAITTHDQASALVHTLDALEIERIHTLVGASYGGMVALAFAERYAERVERLVVISAPARPHPMSTALRAIQRRIVELGLETGQAQAALILARALAMTTYRSAGEFSRRFAADPFAAEEYVIRQATKFAAHFCPARFLALSLSCDLHEVEPRHIRTPAILVAAENDTIVPRDQMVNLAASWGGPCQLVDIPSRVGHDAFLAEPALIARIIANALNRVSSS